MGMSRGRLRAKIALLVAPVLLAGGLSAGAQNRDGFYNGMRQGSRGGYYDRGHDHDRRDGYRRDGGIGPGKGALIGGGGGAVLGALFGGTKGALVGGAAGAGIGAIVGQNHQDNRRRDDFRR